MTVARTNTVGLMLLRMALALAFCVGGLEVQAQRSPFARPASAEPIVETVSGEEMKALMESEGYSVSVDEDGDVVWRMDGYRVYILLAEDGASLMFRATFGDSNATLKKVNAWNSSMRYSRSYIDDEGDPILELDCDLAGGVTRARIIDYLKTCRDSYKAWIEQVVK